MLWPLIVALSLRGQGKLKEIRAEEQRVQHGAGFSHSDISFHSCLTPGLPAFSPSVRSGVLCEAGLQQRTRLSGLEKKLSSGK